MTDLAQTAIVTPRLSSSFGGSFKLFDSSAFPSHFERLGELGRGGMGVVYKARQRGLNRIVALKLLLPGVQVDADDRLRFLSEAEAVAAVKHPNVVQVYEFGEVAGCPYLAMEYVAGGSLYKHLAAHRSFAPDDAARLVESISRGVHAAHEQGIIHRDLKPGNILLAKGDGAEFVPKVTDFGLAKRGGTADLTVTGVTMGTPAYMSPEQARGHTKFVGPGADVYALGVILYECLTGRLPFLAADTVELLQRVACDIPPTPRKFVPDVPVDLELICLKCLEKLPHERYATAAALADDLARFRAGEAVSVRPPGRLEKAVRWVRRYPTRAAVYGLAILATTLGTLAAGALSLWRTAESAHTRAVAATGEAENARARAEAARAEAERLRALADDERVKAEGAQGVAEGERARAEAAAASEAVALRNLTLQKARHDTLLASREYEDGNLPQARRLLEGCPPNYRPWEWRHLDRQFRREVAAVDLGDGPYRFPVTGVGFAADGQVLTTGLALQRWDAAKPKPVVAVPGSPRRLAVSADGKRAAVTGQNAVYDTATWKSVRSIPDSEYVALDGSGNKLLHGGDAGATLRDVDTGDAIPLPAAELLVGCGAVSRDGKTAAVGGARWVGPRPQGGVSPNGAVKVWRIGGGGEPTVIAVNPFAPVKAVALDGTGARFVAGCEDGVVLMCDIATRRLTLLVGHTAPVKAVAFDPSGKRLATASADRTVRVWAADSGTPLLTYKGHASGVIGLAFSADGKRLASAGFEGTVRLWDAQAAPEAVALAGLTQMEKVRAIAVTDDGTRVIVADGRAPVRAFDARTGAEVWPKAAAPSVPLNSLWIGPGKGRVFGVTIGGGLREWDPATGEAKPEGKPLTVSNLARVSSDLSRALMVNHVRAPGGKSQTTVSVLDVRTGKAVATTGDHPAPGDHPAISPDGRRLLTMGLDRRGVVWDADTGKRVCELVGHVGTIRDGAFSPDGRRIATCGHEGTVKVWDPTTGDEVLTLRMRGQGLRVGWSADGTKLVGLDEGGVAHVWDATPSR